MKLQPDIVCKAGNASLHSPLIWADNESSILTLEPVTLNPFEYKVLFQVLRQSSRLKLQRHCRQ